MNVSDSEDQKKPAKVLPEAFRNNIWKKGQKSANPGGRPKGVAAKVKELVGDSGEDVLTFFHRVMIGEEKGFKSGDRIDAGKELLARGFGKPVDIQAHFGVNDESAEDLKALASDALLKLASAVSGKPLPPSTETLDVLPSQGASQAQGTNTPGKAEKPPEDR